MEKSSSYSDVIPNEKEFTELRENLRQQMGNSESLRKKAIELTLASDKYQYGYQWEWCGVPIIRHPDDIVLQQEIVWKLKPFHIVETGVARGGSLVLSSTLMEMQGNSSKVLGLDIQILPHTTEALTPWTSSNRIELIQCDSAALPAKEAMENFLNGSNFPALLILDSNHSHSHVLQELELLTPLLPVGSIVIVADTIIEEMPEDYYPNRPWSRGSNPLSAVHKFLETNHDFVLDKRWSRRSLMGECRDGILVRISSSKGFED